MKKKNKKTFLQLISISLCDNNALTISSWPFSDANIRAVLFKITLKNPINSSSLKFHLKKKNEKILFEQFTSISFWFNNSETISVRPFCAAIINGVSLNTQFFSISLMKLNKKNIVKKKWFEISWKKND